MTATYKQLTEFLVDFGVESVAHTEKSYLAHLIGVYNDLKTWGCSEEVCRAGMFHSIYGTELFQGFTLPLERREEIRAMIGERAERLAYLNCAMDRSSFHTAVLQSTGPYRFTDRISAEEIELSAEDFTDLCTIHLCDWVEQVARSNAWDYRREAYRAIADRLGGIGLASYERVYALS